MKYICIDCNQTFANKSNLNRHKKRGNCAPNETKLSNQIPKITKKFSFAGKNNGLKKTPILKSIASYDEIQEQTGEKMESMNKAMTLAVNGVEKMFTQILQQNQQLNQKIAEQYETNQQLSRKIDEQCQTNQQLSKKIEEQYQQNIRLENEIKELKNKPNITVNDNVTNNTLICLTKDTDFDNILSKTGKTTKQLVEIAWVILSNDITRISALKQAYIEKYIKDNGLIYCKNNKLFAADGNELNKHDTLMLNDGIHKTYMNRLHKERTYQLNLMNIDKNDEYLENQEKKIDEILKCKEKHFNSKYAELAEELRNSKGYADQDEVRYLYNARNLGQSFDDEIRLIENQPSPNYYETDCEDIYNGDGIKILEYEIKRKHKKFTDVDFKDLKEHHNIPNCFHEKQLSGISKDCLFE